MRGRLTSRVIIASGLLVLVVAAAFALLLLAIDNMRDSGRLARQSRVELAGANRVEKLLLDAETGVRGFVITRKERFLTPWSAARRSIPGEARRFISRTEDSRRRRRASAIARSVSTYIRHYSVPVVDAARRGDPSATSVATTVHGKRLVDGIRARLDRFVASERRLAASRQEDADANAHDAVIAASVGLVGSIVLVALFASYLARAIVLPVRRAAAMAGRLAGGDLSVRMPETGVGEIGILERGFNTMGSSLEANRDEFRQLADEQAALRRVATLVAQTSSPSEVFETVTREVGLLSGADLARMERYGSDGTVTGVAAWSRDASQRLTVGSRFELEGVSIAGLVRESGRPERVDSFVSAEGPIAQEARERGIRSSVGCPIIVEGRLWGVIAASSNREAPFPSETEGQIAEFTELVATAIANAESRAELRRIADEQAALRRVATLVARGVSPDRLLESVATEVGGVLGSDATALLRYEPDATATVVAGWNRSGDGPLQGRYALPPGSVTAKVLSTGRAESAESYEGATGPFEAQLRRFGIRSSVGAPIIVDGGLWGVMVAAWMHERPMSPDVQARMAEFIELVATAISNADTRAELAASRARVVAEADRTRRRIERDLHDGTQQRLISVGLELRAAEALVPPGLTELDAQLANAVKSLTGAVEELQEISRGIHPAILSRGGLTPALKALTRRSLVPVELRVGDDGRLPQPLEVAAYYVVSEALTNAAKHARATAVTVDMQTDDGCLRLSITDDGVGGADPALGSGLVGLKDRVQALGGELEIGSAPGQGTALRVTIPIAPGD